MRSLDSRVHFLEAQLREERAKAARAVDAQASLQAENGKLTQALADAQAQIRSMNDQVCFLLLFSLAFCREEMFLDR